MDGEVENFITFVPKKKKGVNTHFHAPWDKAVERALKAAGIKVLAYDTPLQR